MKKLPGLRLGFQTRNFFVRIDGLFGVLGICYPVLFGSVVVLFSNAHMTTII